MICQDMLLFQDYEILIGFFLFVFLESPATESIKFPNVGYSDGNECSKITT